MELQHPRDWGCDLLRSTPQKLGIPEEQDLHPDTKLRCERYEMVVNETRISEAKVTIRELFDGITDWIPRFLNQWSTPPGSAKRLLGWRLLLHAMFPTFSHLNAKTWTQRLRWRRPYEDD